MAREVLRRVFRRRAREKEEAQQTAQELGSATAIRSTLRSESVSAKSQISDEARSQKSKKLRSSIRQETTQAAAFLSSSVGTYMALTAAGVGAGLAGVVAIGIGELAVQLYKIYKDHRDNGGWPSGLLSKIFSWPGNSRSLEVSYRLVSSYTMPLNKLFSYG